MRRARLPDGRCLLHEVVVGEAEATPVGVIRQVEVSGDVSPCDRPGLARRPASGQVWSWSAHLQCQDAGRSLSRQAPLGVVAAAQPVPEGLKIGLVLLGLWVVAWAVILGHWACRALVPRDVLALDDFPGVLALGHRRVPAAAQLRLLWLAHGCSLLWQAGTG